MVALLSFALSLICYGICFLQKDGKLRWMDKGFGFWGAQSWYRKYKQVPTKLEPYDFEPAPDNWYYRFFRVKYKERFPLSTTFLVNFTDGFHATQSTAFIFLSIGISLALKINFFAIWLSVLFLHWLTRRLLSK